jgi:hypothetical protein
MLVESECFALLFIFPLTTHSHRHSAGKWDKRGRLSYLFHAAAD